MKQLLLIILLHTTALFFACSYRSFSPLPYPNILTLNSYPEVFLGRVLTSDSCFKSKVEVIETFNGQTKKAEQLDIYNSSTKPRLCNSSCDEHFYPGDLYVFYLIKNKNEQLINHFWYPTHPLKNRFRTNDENGTNILFLLRYLKNAPKDGITYLKDSLGHKKYYGRMEDGKAIGIWKIYDANSRLYSKGPIKNNLRSGI